MLNRTVLITVGSIVGVIAAGTAAVSANLGILAAADSPQLGDLSATSAATATGSDQATSTTTLSLDPEFIDVYLDDLFSASGPRSAAGATNRSDTATDTPPQSAFESFAVDVAGEVTLENHGDRIEVAEITPASGWTHSTSVASATELSVTFNGARTYVFHASLLDDGTISASVDQPVVVAVPTPTPTTTASPARNSDDDEASDEDHEDEDHEDEDHEDEDHEDEDHEGGDDDD